MAEWFAICDEKGYVKPSVYQGMYNAVYRNDETDLFPLLRKHNCAFYAFRSVDSYLDNLCNIDTA